MKKIILFVIVLLVMSVSTSLATHKIKGINGTINIINTKIRTAYNCNYDVFIPGHVDHGVLNIIVPTKMLLQISFNDRVEALKDIFQSCNGMIREIRIINERNTTFMYINSIELLYLF